MAPSQAQRKTSTPRTESVRFCSGPSGYKGDILADYWTFQRQQSIGLSVVVMSWRKTYTGYSIGCAVVWAVILSVVAVVYREPGQRERHQYLLTEKGHDLFAALVVLMHWGDRWEAAPQGGPVVVRHRER